MYKTHITQWGLDKKNKEFEMRAIVRKKKQRSDHGKRSVIHVRGQLRDFAEIVRYWDRKGVSIDEVIARHATSPTPEAVVFSTPVPSPIMTPQGLAIPERIFLYIRTYLKGSFESGTWIKTQPASYCYSIKDTGEAGMDLDTFHSSCSLAFSLLQKNQFHEATQALNIATARIKQILLAEDPWVLFQLLGVLSQTRRIARDEIAIIVLRQFSDMGKVLLGSEHPLCRIAEWCSRVYNSDFYNVATRCVETATDQFESLLGPLHMSTLYFRTEFIRRKLGNGSANFQMLQELLEKCEKALHPFDVRTVFVRAHLAYVLLCKGHYQESEALFRQNTALPQEVPGITDVGRQNAPKDLYGLAMCLYDLGEEDLGIAALHRSVDVGISMMGLHSNVVCKLHLLESWYCEQGLWDDAAKAHERRVKILESIELE